MSPTLRKLILIGVAALVLRLCWIGFVDNPVLVGDAPWYHARALSILAGNGYSYHGVPTAFFPVGYSLYLSFIYLVAGPSFPAVKIAGALVSTGICVLAYLLAKRLLGPQAAMRAYLILAVFPGQIFYTSILMSEVPFTFLILLFLLLIATPGSRPAFRGFVAGLLLGAAALFRPVGLLFFVWPLLLWHLDKRSQPARSPGWRFAALVLGIFLAVVPWSIRNLVVMKSPVLVSTNGGVNFWMSQVSGLYTPPPARFTANWLHPVSSPNEEVAAERTAYREAFDYLKQHPLAPIVRAPIKLVRMFYSDVDGLLWNEGLPLVRHPKDILPAAAKLPVPLPGIVKKGLFILAECFYLVVLFLAFWRAALNFRRMPAPMLALMLTAAAWVAFHVFLFFPLGRYRFPIMPILVLFASMKISGKVHGLKNSHM